jgi:hypothetical protein
MNMDCKLILSRRQILPEGENCLELFMNDRKFEDKIVYLQIGVSIVCLLILSLACIPIRRIRISLRFCIEGWKSGKIWGDSQCDNRYEYLQRCGSLGNSTKKLNRIYKSMSLEDGNEKSGHWKKNEII